MRGLNKAFLPYYKSPLPNPLQQERELFLNLMAVTRSVGTMRLGIGKIFPTISLAITEFTGLCPNSLL